MFTAKHIRSTKAMIFQYLHDLSRRELLRFVQVRDERTKGLPFCLGGGMVRWVGNGPDRRVISQRSRHVSM